MRFVHAWLIAAWWAAWCVFWFAASAWSKPMDRRESVASGLAHKVPLMVAFRHKIAVEEAFMTAQFPAEYPRYRAEVPSLVPSPFRIHRKWG